MTDKKLETFTFSQFLAIKTVDEVALKFKENNDLEKSIKDVVKNNTSKIVDEYINGEPSRKEGIHNLAEFVGKRNQNLDKDQVKKVLNSVKISSQNWAKINDHIAKTKSGDRTHIYVPTTDYGKELDLLKEEVSKDEPDNRYQKRKKPVLLRAIEEYKKNDVVITPSGFLAKTLNRYMMDKRMVSSAKEKPFEFSPLYGYAISINAKYPRNEVDFAKNYEKEQEIKKKIAPNMIDKAIKMIKGNER
ncbi:MAG: hypothetical protein BWY78_00928 [Alphaproteobacteria bacterium ADurb.Bin438]|nr:MAG: hypothetical protein BWY78_00928 [Alphaproteobacteria bacterium ADurb.Bin438]